MNVREMIGRNRRALLGGAFIAILALITYAPSLGNGFALLDDGLLIFENNAVREFSWRTLKAIFTSYDPELYVPLTIVSYKLDYLIGGYHPFMYHATNLLLHILSSLLVAWIALTLSHRKLVALFVGILFALHPLHVETVAWAAARKDVLSSFFFLAAFASYLRFMCHPEPAEGVKRWYLLSLILFIFGLLSKVTVLTLPIVLLLTELFLQSKKEDRMQSAPSSSPAPALTPALFRTLPYFALSLLFGIIALGGKGDVLGAVSLLEKVFLAGKSTFFVLLKIFFPVQLSPFYPQTSSISPLHPVFLIPLLLTTILTLFSAVYSCTGTSVQRHLVVLRTVAFGWLFFLITLAPTFLTPSKGGENIYITSDRYAYLPSIGILFAVAMVFAMFLENAPDARSQTKRLRGTFLAAGALTLLFIILSTRQSLLWGGNVALFAHAAEVSPNFYFAHINHGAALRLERRHKEAEEAFRRAISLRPLGNTYGLLAQVLAEQKKFDEAIVEFEQGMLLDPKDYELHHGLGQVYALQRNFDAALAEYERALALMPSAENEYLKLSRRAGARRDVVLERIGILYGERGDHARAIEYYKKALAENPYFADAHFNLAVGLGNLGKREEALKHYEEAVRLEPSHIRARVNLAILYAEKGRKREARELLQGVLKDDPGNQIAKEVLRKL
jgi:tetratricopeptide (TPR) repeat protein